MSTMTKTAVDTFPTYQGLDRFPPTGYYDEIPCTCNDECRLNCKGECGCEACKACYSDFLSAE
jgi:hypothetical protein